MKSNKTGIGAKIKVVAQTGSPPLNAKPDAALQSPRGKDPSVGAPSLPRSKKCIPATATTPPAICAFISGSNDAKKVDLVEIRWPSGAIDTLNDLDVKHLYVIEEGGKLLKNEMLTPAKKR